MLPALHMPLGDDKDAEAEVLKREFPLSAQVTQRLLP